MYHINFYTGINCPFCNNQCNQTFSGRGNFNYNKIYCSYCKIKSHADELHSKYELWFLNNNSLISTMTEDICNHLYHSVYYFSNKKFYLFSDHFFSSKEIYLEKWTLQDHFNILYSFISEYDLGRYVLQKEFSLKLKEISENEKINISIRKNIIK